MSAFPPTYLGAMRAASPKRPEKQPMKDINPPPSLPKPEGKKRFAVLPHEYLLPDCA